MPFSRVENRAKTLVFREKQRSGPDFSIFPKLLAHSTRLGTHRGVSRCSLRGRSQWPFFHSKSLIFRPQNRSLAPRKSGRGSVFEFFPGPRALGSTQKHQWRPLGQSAGSFTVRLYPAISGLRSRFSGYPESSISRDLSKFLLTDFFSGFVKYSS